MGSPGTEEIQETTVRNSFGLWHFAVISGTDRKIHIQRFREKNIVHVHMKGTLAFVVLRNSGDFFFFRTFL